jgi:hypothetical protein
LNPSIDNDAPNLPVTDRIDASSGAVQEINLDGQASETSLSVSGYGVRSAD